jgi:flavodoxin
MASPSPSVLFVYYTHTEQTLKVCDAMADVLLSRGCDVVTAPLEFTDPRFAAKFSSFPFKHAIFDLLSILPAQIARKTGEIAIPDAAKEGDYDLVCFGSPTWFFTTNMPLRSYLKSAEAKNVLAGTRFAAYAVCRRYWSVNLKEVKKLGIAQGGTWVDGTRFQFAGAQIRSLIALLSYFGKGVMRKSILGVKLPPTNLKPDYLENAHTFANKLADGLEVAAPEERIIA